MVFESVVKNHLSKVGECSGGRKSFFNSVKHFKRLILNSPVLKDTSLKNISRNDVWTLCYLIQIHKRSLREVETLIRYLEIYHTLCEDLKEDTIFGYSLLSAFGVYLYTFEPKIAEKVLSKTLDGDELLSVFNISKSTNLILNKMTTYI